MKPAPAHNHVNTVGSGFGSPDGAGTAPLVSALVLDARQMLSPPTGPARFLRDANSRFHGRERQLRRSSSRRAAERTRGEMARRHPDRILALGIARVGGPVGVIPPAPRQNGCYV